MEKLLYLKPDTFIYKVEAQTMLAGSEIVNDVSFETANEFGGQEEEIKNDYINADGWTKSSEDWNDFSVN